MLALWIREIKSFLSSLIGYIVIGVFLLIVSLFLWVFPNSFNILDSGFASLDSLFVLSPWVFIFLIPAITMRSFSEERRTGTLELLLTRPLTDLQVVLAKYLSGLTLVLIALIPTLIYYWSIIQLGNPQGNIDAGGTWGSYLGMCFLAAGFVAIGTFASSITPNQIVSFLVSVFLCFFVYAGFDSIGSFALFGAWDGFVLKLGMSEHYRSLSRGLIDTRDVVYFVAVVAVFVLLTQLVLARRRW